MLDTLPFDVFSHTLDFIGVDTDLGIPLCSRSCRELWLEHAEKEIRRLTHLFARHFHFDDETSLTRRYLTVVHAFREYKDFYRELKVMHRHCIIGNVEQERGLVRKVVELLTLNPILALDAEVLPACILALQKAFRLRSLATMVLDDGPPAIVVLEEARPVFVTIFRRLFASLDDCCRDDGMDKLNDICDAAFLVRFILWRSGSSSQREASTRLFYLLAGRAGPAHVPTLVIEACRQLQEATVLESLATYRNAILACTSKDQAHHLNSLVENLQHLQEYYGQDATDALRGDASRIEEAESLVEPGPLTSAQVKFADALETMLHEIMTLLMSCTPGTTEESSEQEHERPREQSVFCRLKVFSLLRSVSSRWSRT